MSAQLLLAALSVIVLLPVALVSLMLLSRRAMLTTMIARLGGLQLDFQARRNGVLAVNGMFKSGGVPARDYGPLTWLPLWSQQQGVLPDGTRDPAWASDCGETCVSMVVAAVHGTPVLPGAIRQFLFGTSGSGLSEASDLVGALAEWSTASSAASLSAALTLPVLRSQWAAAMPVILLGHWLGPDSLHWVVMSGMTGQGVQVVDPWSGHERVIAFADFSAQYAGSCVTVGAHLHYNMRGQPTPGS